MFLLYAYFGNQALWLKIVALLSGWRLRLAAYTQRGSALPPEWESAQDPASGDTYYIHKVTGETTWDRPKPVAPPVLVPPAPTARALPARRPLPSMPARGANASRPLPSMPAARGGGPRLPPGWQQVLDPRSGEYYYENAYTGQSSWEPPRP